jgi:predicted ATPase
MKEIRGPRFLYDDELRELIQDMRKAAFQIVVGSAVLGSTDQRKRRILHEIGERAQEIIRLLEDFEALIDEG